MKLEDLHDKTYIGGAPRSGKTSLATSNASGDIIHLDKYRMKLYNQLNTEQQNHYFPIIGHAKSYPKCYKKILTFCLNNGFDLGYIRKIGIMDNLESYINNFGIEKYLDDEFLSQDIITSKFLSSNKQGSIIEGVSLSPKIIREKIDIGSLNIDNVVFLIKSDIDDIIDILNNNPGSFKLRDKYLMAKVIKTYGERILLQAQKYKLHIIDTSKHNIL